MSNEGLIADFTSLLKDQRYSFSTIKIYKKEINSFLRFFGDKNIKHLSAEFVQSYIDSALPGSNYSSACNLHTAAAIRLFYKSIFQTDIKLKYPEKRINKLPVILKTDQIKYILGHIKNIKHRTLLSLIYSAGLRLNEAINLKKSSVSMTAGKIYIASGLNFRSRSISVSSNMLLLLGEYFRQYNPQCWLFETNKNASYSPRTVQQIFKNALLTSGVKNEATVHTLRHSFAVHLIEEGIDLKLVQQILGHKSIKSTIIYRQLSNINMDKIINPFDC